MTSYDEIQKKAWESTQNSLKEMLGHNYTNGIHYAQQLLDIWNEGTQFGVSKDGVLDKCSNIECSKCKFFKGYANCSAGRKEWLNEEFKDPTDDLKEVARLAAELFDKFEQDTCDECKRPSCIDCDYFGNQKHFESVLKELADAGKIEIKKCETCKVNKEPVKKNPSGENWDKGIDMTAIYCSHEPLTKDSARELAKGLWEQLHENDSKED